MVLFLILSVFAQNFDFVQYNISNIYLPYSLFSIHYLVYSNSLTLFFLFFNFAKSKSILSAVITLNSAPRNIT